MGIANIGGNASASNTLSNIINFAPSIQTGSDNKSDLASSFDQRASSEALNKDSLSASAGVSGSGSAMGGTASLSDVVQGSGNMMNGASNAILRSGGANSPEYVKYGLILAGGVGIIYAIKKLKKPKQ